MSAVLGNCQDITGSIVGILIVYGNIVLTVSVAVVVGFLDQLVVIVVFVGDDEIEGGGALCNCRNVANAVIGVLAAY